MAAPRIIWTVDADGARRATLPDGRRLWAWRSEPGCWHYGLTHPGHLGDVANFYICHTPAQARADALAMAGHLRATCRPIRAMRLGIMRDGYNVHPVTGEGADQHNTQRVPFGPVMPDKVTHFASPTGSNDKPAQLAPVSPLAATVADPADPATETGDAYADRQMAAYGVEPTRWTTDALQDAHAHLTAAGVYPDHAARISAELVARGVQRARCLPAPPRALLLALATPVLPGRA